MIKNVFQIPIKIFITNYLSIHVKIKKGTGKTPSFK